MNISSKKRILVICAQLVPAIYGLAAFAAPVSAQTAAATAASQAGSVTDEELSRRVKSALHSDPYFYDEHVSVSVENGDVVLRGFVFSAEDLLDAMHIARQAAGDRRVVDNLSIKLGGSP